MPPSEQERAERLHRALEGREPLRDGPADGVPALVAAARDLGAAESAPGLPSPTFVLGLEEQLRTDLRLGLAGSGSHLEPPAGGSSAARRPLVLLAAIGLLLLMLASVWNAGPFHPLYGARLRLDGLRVSVAGLFSSGRDGAAEFDAGRRLLEDARVVVERPEVDRLKLSSILRRLPGVYSAGAEAAAASDDQGALIRAHIEVQAAAAELARLGGEAGPDERVVLDETRAALSDLLPPATGPVAGLPPAAPTAFPTSPATARPAAPTSAPTDEPPDTPAPPPTAEPTRTIVPPSATPSATPTSTAPPPRPTREEPEPSATIRPIEPTATPEIVWPTPTRDIWPTPTREGAPLPTPGPTEQVRPPAPQP